MTMTRLEDYESYNGKYIVQLTKDPQRSPESKKYKTFDQAKRAGINCLKSERYFESAFDMTREEWLECSLVDEIPNEFYIRQIETYNMNDFDKGDGWQNMADAARETLGCLTCLFGFLFTLAVYALAAYGAYCFFVR